MATPKQVVLRTKGEVEQRVGTLTECAECNTPLANTYAKDGTPTTRFYCSRQCRKAHRNASRSKVR